MADTSVVVALIGEDRLSAPATAAARAITGIEHAATAASSSVGRTESVFAGVLRGGLALGAIGAVIGGLKTGLDALGEAAIGGNARLEQLQVGFTTLLKSGADAEAFMFQMQQFAAATPFSFEDVAVGARNLLAMGFAGKDVLPILTDLGNVVAGLGGSSADVQRLARVLGQMQTTGKVLAGDLMQLASAGVNLGRVYEIMAQQTGRSTAELHKMQEQGKLSTDVFIRAFRTMAQSDFGGAMEAQSKTFTGAMSTITDSLGQAAQFAFKPFFDRVSELAQTIAAFVQKDEFFAWAARIAAAVDVALEGLGTLAGGFATGLGAVLDITLSLGQAIYEALSWLNPFATHSPSLVWSVETGVDAMVEAYGELGRAVPQITATKKGIEALREEMDRAKDEAKAYADGVKDAERAIADLGRQALTGEGAMSDQMFAMDQQIARVQLSLNNLRLSNAPKASIDAVEKSLDKLRTQADNLRLQDKLKFDPQHRAIDQLINPRNEKDFAAVTGEIKKNQAALTELRPAAQASQERVDALGDVLKASEKGLRDVEAAAKAAAAGVGGMGGAIGGSKNALDGFKETIAASKEQLEQFKQRFDEAKESFRTALTTGPLGEALAAVKGGFDAVTTAAATTAEILKTGGIPALIAAIGQAAEENFPKTAQALEDAQPATLKMIATFVVLGTTIDDLVKKFDAGSGSMAVDFTHWQTTVDQGLSLVIVKYHGHTENFNLMVSAVVEGYHLFERTMQSWNGVLSRWSENAGKAVDAFIRDFKAGWTGFGAAVSAILRGELSQIKIDMGPFHLGPGGFTVDPPTFPNITMPRMPDLTAPKLPWQNGGGTATGGGATPAFQHGGYFRVGGTGGPDSQLVAFRASPGEGVAVGWPERGGQRGDAGGAHVTINLGGVTVSGQADEERLVARLRDEVERYFTDGLRAARGTGQRFPLGVGAPGSG